MQFEQNNLRWRIISLFAIVMSLNSAFAANETYQAVYRQSLTTQSIQQNLQYYTSLAHIAGSDRDLETAQKTLEKFQEYGILDSWIEDFEVTLSYPLSRSLLVYENNVSVYNASLKEPPITDDPTSSLDAVPTFNGYSPSGDVNAPVIFVNYGSVEDYDTLNALNISVVNKIVIARYGKLFRGCKVMLAEMHGAVGVILYSDPKDDGEDVGPTYPDGPWRPLDAVQRGSVQYLSKCPGDPDRNHSDCTNNMPKIPVQPISANEAAEIITRLRGTPSNWTTHWNMNTTLGNSGSISVHLKLDMQFSRKSIWNVFGKIVGTEEDRNVMIGAHRDAWVFGGVDPVTGTSVLLEIAHGLGNMSRNGWIPARTILLASWDGEEYGLLGSTWYGENNKSSIQNETIAYLNLDMAVFGNNFEVDATPSLNAIIKEIATQVNNPKTNSTIAANWDGEINVLGSGSDYTVFIHHLGIPSANFGFSGPYGVYHSIYDSYTWVQSFGDTNFSLHKAMAEYVGLLAINITDAEIFPFNYTDYAHELSSYLNETAQLVSQLGASSNVNLHPLEVAIKNFTKIAHNMDKEIKNINREDSRSIVSINDRLIDAEMAMLDDDGLPQRPWYKHQIQAPGYYLGYGAEIFPGITQSLNDKNWTQANQFIAIVAECITKSAGVLMEDGYGTISQESYLGYQIFMILFTVFIIGSFVAAIWYFRKSRRQFHRNNKYAMVEMDEQM